MQGQEGIRCIEQRIIWAYLYVEISWPRTMKNSLDLQVQRTFIKPLLYNIPVKSKRKKLFIGEKLLISSQISRYILVFKMTVNIVAALLRISFLRQLLKQNRSFSLLHA